LGFDLQAVLFYVFGAATVGFSLLVVLQKSPIYSVLMLIGSFGALAGLYVLLDAPFTAVTQIIIYAGAIMVLFLFVVMLLNVPREDAAEYDRTHPLDNPTVRYAGGVLVVVLAAELGWSVWHASTRHGTGIGDVTPGNVSSVAEIGRKLFTDYAFPFEVTSILILVAMVGAVILARRIEE
jgi:NADH-quinone oxidoreductase subunit J